MLRSKLAISGAVMALGAGGVLATPGMHAAAAPAGVMSVTITPESSPLLLGAKAAVTASVADGAVARKGEVLKFEITSTPIHARVDTNTVKLPTPLGGLLAGALTLTFLTPPSGEFWLGETVNIVDPNTHQNEKVTIAGGPTSPPTPAGLLWTLTAPTQFTHISGTITGSWAATDPTTGAGAPATITAGTVVGTQDLTVFDESDSAVVPVVVPFTQSLPILDTPSQKFVRGVYLNLLNRQPDPDALTFWSGAIDAAGDSVAAHAAFVNALLTSLEYRSDVISSFYGLYLQRAIDQAGVNFWVGQVAAGASFEQVRLAFVGSPEFFSTTNAGSPSEAINALYSEVLGRPDGDASDPNGAAYWLAHFNVNTIAAQFLFSPEGRNFLVSGYYQSILQRAADPVGLAFWTLRLLTGASDENILLDLLTSTEFLSLF